MNLIEEYEMFEEEYDCKLPKTIIVCRTCRGTGNHVNPSIDGNGITQSEMEELGDDFLDQYLTGFYNVTCIDCEGNNVSTIVDEDRLDKKIKDEFLSWMESAYESEAIASAERRMGY